MVPLPRVSEFIRNTSTLWKTETQDEFAEKVLFDFLPVLFIYFILLFLCLLIRMA